MSRDLPDLYEKYKRFKSQKTLDKDPLIRWCTKAGCDTYMKAENDQATKLTCPKCSTEICFKCRNNWHGDLSCEDALKEQFSGWAKENQFIKDNISFCPMCRTKIEKNAGCNHMTCQVCKYEFCWACGASASNKEDHFNPYNPKNCGAKMMDETVKPNTKKSGEGEKKTITFSLSLWIFIKCLFILFFF